MNKAGEIAVMLFLTSFADAVKTLLCMQARV